VVEGDFAGTVVPPLAVDDDAAPFVRDVEQSSSSQHIRYRFALREAAERLMDAETAIAAGEAWIAPPSTWLLHPRGSAPGTFRFHVATQPPAIFVAGTHPSADAIPGSYEAPTSTLGETSFAAFGSLSVDTLSEGDARVLVAIAGHDLKLSRADVVAWVQRSVHAIADYARAFPAPRTLVIVMANKPDSVTRGETLGEGGPAVLVRAGGTLTSQTTRDDWVMTHELLHVALPSLPRDQAWLSEGIPSYVEPIARLRAGLTTAEKVWLDLVHGLPQGLPQPEDQGLDHTHTWGRTYWGGSLFCFLADVRIRERTGNARSFDDVVRAVVASGADVESHWEIARLVDTGDRATGTNVLGSLYREMALAPGSVDLPSLWKQLGILTTDDRVTFDDSAALAYVRRGITGR
jgi:hypothetical protein